MIEKEINLFKNSFSGKLCKICTGCGKCNTRMKDIKVITNSFQLPNTYINQGWMVSVDIGTTTVAMELYHQGRKEKEFVKVNSQRTYGFDVLSRIKSAEDPILFKKMKAEIWSILEEGMKIFLEISADISSVYIAANTTMTYLLLGYPLTELGKAPFVATYIEEYEIELCGIKTIVLPAASAFIGGDIIAGIFATGIFQTPQISLLIDLGTNGEIVLGNSEKLVACSTAAGPAFEGGKSSKTNGDIVWGTDKIKCIAKLLDEKILDETGLLIDEYFDTGVQIDDILISQEEIRDFQTAKAAIAAGIDVLCKEYEISDKNLISKIYLSGGFGYFVDVPSAIKVGLLPEIFWDKVITVGNTALAGAYIYESISKEQKTELKNRIKIYNLAENADFSELYIDAMYLKKW